MHSPACRHRQQPTPRDHQEPASGEGSGHTGTPASCKQNRGLLEAPRVWGEHTPQPEWQGLEVPREQPLTPGRLDPLGPCCLLRRAGSGHAGMRPSRPRAGCMPTAAQAWVPGQALHPPDRSRALPRASLPKPQDTGEQRPALLSEAGQLGL